MPLGAGTIWYIQTSGSDTANGGGFDPGQVAGMLTDGVASSGTGASPVFTSASYAFASGDVGAWVYIASGTNWNPGWYPIASVSAGAATLSAAAGAGQNGGTRYPTTSAGVGTVAGPTGATWAIDYSRGATARISYTDLASTGAGLTVSSAANPIGRQQVGNAIVVTGGTNFTAGVYVIASVAAGVATVVGPGNITSGAGTGGTGGLGGAFASPGKAGSVHVAGNNFYIRSGTYTVTSASNNVAGGCLSVAVQAANANAARIVGFGTVPGDYGAKPVVLASGISSFTLVTVGTGNRIENVTADGAGLTQSRGIQATNGSAYKCKGQNCKNTAIFGGECTLCEATGCSVAAALLPSQGLFCYSHDNTFTGMGVGASSGLIVGCVSVNNTGASSHGFDFQFGTGHVTGCTFANNGGDGVRFNGAVGNAGGGLLDSVIYGNAGWGVNAGAAYDHYHVTGCYLGSNTAGPINNNISLPNQRQNVTLSADPFVDASARDYSLNNTPGGGALVRASSVMNAFAGGTTSGFKDGGAVQHQDTGGGGASNAAYW
ncbi:hypothetical protein VT84_07320 [Gemmata sp. SH-PL17]|uniref:hypothetical protein n=1 Tax=Gemmata sp. SH-PL17 TaxID=1630693 RepID=UPI00078CBAA6|nr:hypothetical protein [Gemmata sp. SH-PL17]AMV24190.1 hypothetical protein VT84_07320 [Gemmata sp. SH-PL17]